jgi:lysozyme family protein
MTDLFKRCLAVVLDNEGGYSDHPMDSGHATMMGVTQAVYDSYCAKLGLPFNPVIDITEQEVFDVYYTLYWLPANLEKIDNDLLALHVFDHGVNAGVRTTVRLLQRLMGVEDDGVIGNFTIKAIKEYNGNIVEDFIKRRKLFYITLVQNKPQLRIFIKGWIKRVDNCYFKEK